VFLGDQESLLYSGLVQKKRWLSVKKRQLLLTDRPRLIYLDPATMTQKGEIKFTADLRTEVINGQQFNIHVPSRTYHLTGLSSSANVWVKKINQVLETFVKDNDTSQQGDDGTTGEM
jgi:3-phosphoinositide dependent protein kinase-1